MESLSEVSLEPSLLQAEQSQMSQPVFIGEALQLLDYLCGLPLNSFQQIYILLMLGTPKMDAVLERQKLLSYPSGHVAFDAAQDMVGFRGCEYRLLLNSHYF